MKGKAKKSLVLGIIILFVGTSMIPFIENVRADPGYEINTGSLGIKSQRKLARSSDGVLHSVYCRLEGSYYRIYHAYSTNDGMTWTEEPESLSPPSQDSRHPCIAIDQNDNIHVAWCWWRAPAGPSWYGTIQYRVKTTSWQALENNVITGYYDFPSLAIDSEEIVHLAVGGYSGGSWNAAGVQYLKKITPSSSWSAPYRVSSSSWATAPVLVVDGNDDIHILYAHAPRYGPYYGFRYRRTIDDSWQGEEIVQVDDGLWHSGSIALDSNGNVYAVWCHGTTGLIRIRERMSSGWQTPDAVFVPDGYSQQDPVVSIDTNNNIHVVWCGKNVNSPNFYQIRYRQYPLNGNPPLDITSSTVNQEIPNLIWAWYPVVNGVHTNIPQNGYAFVWNDGPVIRFYKSSDLTWDGGGSQPSQYVRTTDKIYVRSYPGLPTGNTNAIAYLPKGCLLQTKPHITNGILIDGYHWQFVQIGTSSTTGDITGWCAQEFLIEYSFPFDAKVKNGVMATGYHICSEQEIEDIADSYPEKYKPTEDQTINGVGTFNRAFLFSAKGVVMQGSGRDHDNRLIKCLVGKKGWFYDENNHEQWIKYEESVKIYHEPKWPQTPVDISEAAGYGVLPWRTIAVDKNVIPLGSIVYISQLDGKVSSNGEIIDGYFIAMDKGGGIEGLHIDVFLGYGNSAVSNWGNLYDLTLKYDDSNKWEYEGVKLGSPGELRVIDSQDRITGVINEQAINDIPYTLFDNFEDKITMLFPTDTYRYVVKGTEDGTYNLSIESYRDGAENFFNAIDIPIIPNAIHQYIIDWQALAEAEKGVTLQIDTNGDSIFERTITSDSDLTQDEFILLTATTIDFDPNTLNRNSNGKWVTTYIELPEGFNVSNISIGSILLNGIVPAQASPTNIGDYDNDGIPDLMVKFSRSAVTQILQPGNNVEITISGTIIDGMEFEGVDHIRVI